MDMTEDNEHLLQQFFSEAAIRPQDDGFSRRVMQHLPSRINWFERLWTACCVLTFLALFVAFRGWELLAVHFEVLLRTLAVHCEVLLRTVAVEPVSVNPLMLATILFGLLFVGVGEVVLREHR
jgi:hypothetical protein